MPTLLPANTDPTPLFELFRGSFATELLTAAVCDFNVFGRLAQRSLAPGALQTELGLAERPFVVLSTALRAFGLLDIDSQGALVLTELARNHLVPGAPHDIGGYIGLAAETPGVRNLVERLCTNRPAGSESEQHGTAFIFRPEVASAMEAADSARQLTLALAGRAKNVAPHLAAQVPLDDARLLLDVGGGTGLYSIAWLQRHRQLRAIVWDRPQVLAVAREFAQLHGVADRLEGAAGDMFADPVPTGADVCLLSNVLHDWDVPECRRLVARCAAALVPGGRLVIHDVLSNDALDGPLPIALYSASLFSLTEGRAYSRAEFALWLDEAGLKLEAVRPTLVHCHALVVRKPG